VASTGSLQTEDVLILEDTVIYKLTYFLHYDARNFVQPDEFIPERRIEKQELLLNRTTFITFSVGMTKIVGKRLAVMDLRSVIARTVFELDARFPAGVDFDVSFCRV